MLTQNADKGINHLIAQVRHSRAPSLLITGTWRYKRVHCIPAKFSVFASVLFAFATSQNSRWSECPHFVFFTDRYSLAQSLQMFSFILDSGDAQASTARTSTKEVLLESPANRLPNVLSILDEETCLNSSPFALVWNILIFQGPRQPWQDIHCQLKGNHWSCISCKNNQ